MVLAHVTYGTQHFGRPVVFLGSIASTTDMWLPQLDALSQQRRVIAIDHPGHGNSATWEELRTQPGALSIPLLGELVLRTLDHLGVAEFDLVGLSLGGAVTQYLAAHSPRVQRAALLCTAPKFGEPEKWEHRSQLVRSEGMAPMVDGILDIWLDADYQQQHPASSAWHRRMIAGIQPEGYASCCDALAQWDFREAVAGITCPVITIAGEDDASTPPSTLRALADATSGPAQHHVVPGGHVPTISAAAEINRILSEFLV